MYFDVWIDFLETVCKVLNSLVLIKVIICKFDIVLCNILCLFILDSVELLLIVLTGNFCRRLFERNVLNGKRAYT